MVNGIDKLESIGYLIFDEDRVLYNAINFYENGGVTVNSLNANAEDVHKTAKLMLKMAARSGL